MQTRKFTYNKRNRKFTYKQLENFYMNYLIDCKGIDYEDAKNILENTNINKEKDIIEAIEYNI